VTWTINKPHDAWVHQAKDAWAALEPQPLQGSTLRDLAAIDQPTFALLIEALYALKPGEVSQDLQDLAGLCPIAAVRGMRDLNTDDEW